MYFLKRIWEDFKSGFAGLITGIAFGVVVGILFGAMLVFWKYEVDKQFSHKTTTEISKRG